MEAAVEEQQAAGGGIDAEPDEEAGVIARFLRRKSAILRFASAKHI